MKNIFGKSTNYLQTNRMTDNFRTPTAKEFGKLLKELREAKRLTQEELAQLANISTRSYQKNEQGETWMSTETFLKLMLALDRISINTFYVKR